MRRLGARECGKSSLWVVVRRRAIRHVANLLIVLGEMSLHAQRAKRQRAHRDMMAARPPRPGGIPACRGFLGRRLSLHFVLVDNTYY